MKRDVYDGLGPWPSEPSIVHSLRYYNTKVQMQESLALAEFYTFDFQSRNAKYSLKVAVFDYLTN